MDDDERNIFNLISETVFGEEKQIKDIVPALDIEKLVIEIMECLPNNGICKYCGTLIDNEIEDKQF